MVKANAIPCDNAFTIFIILCYVNIFYARTNVSPLTLAFVPFNGDKSVVDTFSIPFIKYRLFVSESKYNLFPRYLNSTSVPSVFLFVLTFKTELPSASLTFDISVTYSSDIETFSNLLSISVLL